MVIPDPRPLENHLHRISRRFISIEDDVNTAYRKHFDNISSYMVQFLKDRDALFAKLFQVLQLAGSYADGIKVEAPNEFDVLVLLKFPRPVPVSSVPGYVNINIRDGMNAWMNWITGNSEAYRRFVDSEGYLIQDQILDWLRVLVRKILSENRNTLSICGTTYDIRQENHGPAVTLCVTIRGSAFGTGYFSIDFVPALQFQSNDHWVADERSNLYVQGRFWNAIPKPNRTRLHNNRDWICSYAEIERDYLNGLNRLKPLIKIFKKIRDKAHLTNLKSYYIKTIFLHHRLEVNESYWNRSLAVLFMEMFDVILGHLQSRTLGSLWHRNYNLFSQVNEQQIDAIYYNLRNIKDKIVRNLVNGNAGIIYQQILTHEEMIEMESREKVEESQSWCTIL